MNMKPSLSAEAEAFATEILQQRLPQHLAFHNYAHTQYVAQAVRDLAIQNGLSGHETELVLAAAWLHDIGYTKTAQGHEYVSIEMADTFFKARRLSKKDIKLIADCILATQIPQSPNHALAQILCDADLYHLSDSDFFEICMPLRQEWDANRENPMTDVEWLEINRNFLEKHSYFTEYGKNILENKKQENLAEVRKRLDELQA
jgi:predicted metal-dependent HD superfamily phosphohydrolase